LKSVLEDVVEDLLLENIGAATLAIPALPTVREYLIAYTAT
jgi:hypothetical protein